MSHCAQCGYTTNSPGELCAHHIAGYGSPSVHGDDWAAGNRMMCDFLHRGIVVAAACTARRDHDDLHESPTWTEVGGR